MIDANGVTKQLYNHENEKKIIIIKHSSTQFDLWPR